MNEHSVPYQFPSVQEPIDLETPEKGESTHTALGGGFILKMMWEKLNITLCFIMAGFNKQHGVPYYHLSFAFIWGLYLAIPSFSIVKLLQHIRNDGLISYITSIKPSKWKKDVFYRLLKKSESCWRKLLVLVMKELKKEEPLVFQGKVKLALDDTTLPHPYAEKNPLLKWLVDGVDKKKVFGMSLVTILLLLPDGRQYPLIFRYTEPNSPKTKYGLSIEMLKELSQLFGSAEITLTMDAWYGASQPFLEELNRLGIQWVTRGRKNFVFHERIENSSEEPRRRGRPRQWNPCRLADFIAKHPIEGPDSDWKEREGGHLFLNLGVLYLRRRINGKTSTFPTHVILETYPCEGEETETTEEIQVKKTDQTRSKKEDKEQNQAETDKEEQGKGTERKIRILMASISSDISSTEDTLLEDITSENFLYQEETEEIDISVNEQEDKKGSLEREEKTEIRTILVSSEPCPVSSDTDSTEYLSLELEINPHLQEELKESEIMEKEREEKVLNITVTPTPSEMKSVFTAHKIMDTYACRWGIEIFFRRVKQAFNIKDCHLQSTDGVMGYTTLIFIADTLQTLTYRSLDRLNTEKSDISMSVLRTPCECRFYRENNQWKLIPIFTAENACLDLIKRFFPKKNPTFFVG